MHPCEEYKALISALIDDEISDTDRGSLMAHLIACEDCRLYWEDQFAIHEAMADLSVIAPVGFADGVMARIRETKQEQPKRKIISFPRRFAGLAACCAVVVLGIFAARGGILTMNDSATSNCAAPEMAYSLMNESQTADTTASDSEEAVYEKFAMPPAAAGGDAWAQSKADNGACVTDSSAAYGTMVAYAACIATESEVAVQWVETTLGQTWNSGTVYSLTAEEYMELLSLLENNSESFEIFDGNGELYQLLAR